MLSAKVENMTGRTGKPVKNQFIIETKEGRFFQSYSTVIAFIPADGGPVQLDKWSWDYSKTTAKYRNMFLDETGPETAAKIDQGAYVLTDLNHQEG